MSDEKYREDELQYEIYTPGEQEKQQEMKKLLISHFDGKDPLFAIYKQRDWLDRLFTPKILSMDPNMLYSTREVAEICETEIYNINNKRKELIDYVQPKKLDSFSYKHDYISAFKLKMIVGLTVGEKSFTVTQLRSIIGGTENLEPDEEEKIQVNLRAFQEKYQELVRIIDMISPEGIKSEISKFVKEEVNKHFKSLPPVEENIKNDLKQELGSFLKTELEQVKKKEDEVKNEIARIYNEILSPETDLDSKQKMLRSYDELIEKHPDFEYLIQLHKDMVEKKIKTFKHEIEQLRIKEVKARVLKLFDIYRDKSSTQEMKENAIKELEELLVKERDLEFEIRYYITLMTKEHRESAKKGFFRRLFSR
jgi:hypothetical protein